MDYTTNPNFYLDGNKYKFKYICFDCRKIFKRKILSDFENSEECFDKMAKCPQCNKESTYIGQKFRAPKIENEQAWNSLKILLDIGVLGYDGWASPSVKLFGTKKALKDYLETLKEETKCLINKMYSKEINSHQSQIIKKIDFHLKNLKS
ncbi:MAG: hypothetical protein IPL21_13300 [Saprospirales bacterium]|jgi:hypothetical protein|nr:hypothetical protein [Saprospirales bacterium]